MWPAGHVMVRELTRSVALGKRWWGVKMLMEITCKYTRFHGRLIEEP